MLFSPVIADGAGRGAVSFVAGSGNLFNVAITRARAALVVVGDARSSIIERVPHLARFRDYVAELDEPGTELTAIKPVDYGPTYPKIDGAPQESEWEHVLYEALYSAGVVSMPQVTVENYRLDLAVLHDGRKLDIEVDGEHYHRAWDGELAVRDQLRSQRLIELGWDVMRFWVYQVRDDLPSCVERVRQWVAASHKESTIRSADPSEPPNSDREHGPRSLDADQTGRQTCRSCGETYPARWSRCGFCGAETERMR